jgi:hypothetical protein
MFAQLFDADKELIKAEAAKPFPRFEAESLLGVTHEFTNLLMGKDQVNGSLLSMLELVCGGCWAGHAGLTSRPT